MGSATTATPHDALFKAAFEAPEHAAGLFREVLPAAIVAAIPETEQVTMTMAEQLLARGQAKGRIEGRAEGRAEGCARALSKQMGLKFGPLSAEHAERIAAATEEQLDLYIERILTALTPEAVFHDP